MKTVQNIVSFVVLFSASFIVGIAIGSMFHIKVAQRAVDTVVAGKPAKLYTVQLNEKNEPVDALHASELDLSGLSEPYDIQPAAGYIALNWSMR